MRPASYAPGELIPCALVWHDPGITPCCKTILSLGAKNGIPELSLDREFRFTRPVFRILMLPVFVDVAGWRRVLQHNPADNGRAEGRYTLDTTPTAFRRCATAHSRKRANSFRRSGGISSGYHPTNSCRSIFSEAATYSIPG